MKTQFNEIKEIEMNEMQYCRFFTMCHFQKGVISGNTFYELSKETLYDDNRNAIPQEKCCAGHIVRKVGSGINNINVIRDDGTVWSIALDTFKEVTPVNVKMI